MRHEVKYAEGVVVWVKVYYGPYTHQLQGMDRFWVHEDSQQWGMYNLDTEQYEGRQYVSWQWVPEDNKVVQRNLKRSPNGSVVYKGEWVSDELAKKLGIL